MNIFLLSHCCSFCFLFVCLKGFDFLFCYYCYYYYCYFFFFFFLFLFLFLFLFFIVNSFVTTPQHIQKIFVLKTNSNPTEKTTTTTTTTTMIPENHNVGSPPSFSPKPQGSGRVVIWFSQLQTMLWKNGILAIRNRKLTCMQLIFPIVFIFLLFLLGLVPKYGGPVGNQPQMNATQVPFCIPRGKGTKCFSFMFGPSNDTVVQDIVGRVANANGFGDLFYLNDINDPEIDSIPSGSVVGMKTWQELQDFLIQHQNFTQAVLFFNTTDQNDDSDSDGLTAAFENRVETFFQQPQQPQEGHKDVDVFRHYSKLMNPSDSRLSSSRLSSSRPFSLSQSTTTPTISKKKSGSFNQAVRRSSPLSSSLLSSLSDSFDQFTGFLTINGMSLPPPFSQDFQKRPIRAIPSLNTLYDEEDTNEPLNYRSTWNVKYELWFNSTCTNLLYNPSIDGSSYTSPIPTCPDIRPQLQFSADCAIIEYLLGDSATEGVDCQLMLQASTWVDLGVNDTVQSYGVLFFFCAMMFVFVVLVYQVAFEKDKNLKLGMQLMGLKESVFWVSWFITALVTSIIAILCVMTMGYICQFSFFWESNFFVVFITFFLFSFSMIGLSLMVSVIVGTAKEAISVGMFLYIFGVIIEIFLGNQSFVEFIYTKDLLAANILRPIFMCYPPFSFAKIVLDISALSYDIGGEKGPGYTWSDLTKDQRYGNLVVQSDFESWGILLMDAALYYFLAWFLSNILPSDTGSGSPPWFFLTPSYWGCSCTSSSNSYDGVDYVSIGSRMYVAEGEGEEAIRIAGLKKIYHKYPFGIRSDSDVLAVNGLDLTIDQGELFCLLGHNGAGKTTTINMLTGLYTPTEGTITVFDKDIETDLEAVRSEIGICPQHDILWLEMTPEEHLWLFSRFFFFFFFLRSVCFLLFTFFFFFFFLG